MPADESIRETLTSCFSIASFEFRFFILPAKTAVAPNSWAVICLWRRFFQLREEQNERSVEAMASAIDQVVEDRVFRPIACEEVVQARRDILMDYYRRILDQAACVSSQAIAASEANQRRDSDLASFVERAQEAQDARVRRNQPILSIPAQDGNGMVFDLAQ